MVEVTQDSIPLLDIDWSNGGLDAAVIFLQWNDGWGIWEQVIDEAQGRTGVVAWTRVTTAQAQAAAQEQRIAELEGALKPFALIADMDEGKPDGAGTTINVNLCRKARAALGEQQ